MALRQNISQYKGRYHRTIGYAYNSRGRLAKRKFLLGTDWTAAQIANALLQKLWQEVVAEHEDTVRWMQGMGGRLADTNLITGEIVALQRDLSAGPHWRHESLLIAEAVRRGQHRLAVHADPKTQPLLASYRETPGGYVDRIAALRRTYTTVDFVPAALERYMEGQRLLTEEAQATIAEANYRAHELVELAQQPLPASGPMLYEALSSYAQYIRRTKPTEYGRNEADRAERLKASHADVPLHQFGLSALEQIADYWRARREARGPDGAMRGRPISLHTVQHQLKTTRRFIKWLDRSENWEWEAPRHCADVLHTNVERLRTDAEIAALKNGVLTWTLDELVQLYRHATDQDRLLLLLGLNLGAAQAEICTLRHEEVNLESNPPIIKRIRRKTSVYGEFPLWSETVKGIDWHIQQHQVNDTVDKEYLLITGRGRKFDRNRISNAWNALLNRVQQHDAGFRRLSFKHLRKTAGQMIRTHSDGEVAGVFLCHGKPVASDGLSDAYSNRPFDKVAQALMAVRADLKPMFDAAPDAFSNPQTRRRQSTAISEASTATT